MPYQPRFTYTHSLVLDLMKIEGARRVMDLLPLPLDIDLEFKERARAKSTHHSTKIEGNRIAETAVPYIVAHPDRQSHQEQEVRNYWRALEWMEIQMDARAPVTESFVRELHALVMPAGPGRAKKRNDYRAEEVGVIDHATRNYDYMAPSWQDVGPLMTDLASWVSLPEAQSLPAPVRAAILGYQFVTIHPFRDGNGRVARALATYELWRSGYWMRGFISMEEYYTRDQRAYYANLQMGLPANYYDGRHDPDLTPWVEYFVGIMAEAAEEVRTRAAKFHQSSQPRRPEWDRLSRLEQQVLTRILILSREGRTPLEFRPREIAEWLGVTDRTAREWLTEWASRRFVEPADAGDRVRRWKLSPAWSSLVERIARTNGKAEGSDGGAP